MRASVITAAVIAGLTIIGTASGQESDVPQEIDSLRAVDSGQARGPAMVVREVVTEAPKVTATPLAPKPIVVSGESTTGPTAPANSTGNPAYDKMVFEAAARHGLDPNLIFAVMKQESGFNPRALSYKGASGLMQLMPDTARRFGVTRIWDPAQNIEGGARYLRFLLDTFNGDVTLALAGYNAGENAVIGAGYRIPRYRETQAYVRNISARYGAAGRSRAPKKAEPLAPSAMLFRGGDGSRLSNNY